MQVDQDVAPQGASLADAVLQIGTAAFPQTLLKAARDLADVDHCMVFGFQSDATVRCLLDVGSIGIGGYLGAAYSEKFYESDPNRDVIFNCKDSRKKLILPSFEKRAYSRQYQQTFFDDAKIVDKFAVAQWINDQCYYTNFYRLERGGCFDATEIHRLNDASEIISAAVLRHCEISAPIAKQSTVEFLERAFHQESRLASLTAREREVCIFILLGYSSEAISELLGVSVHSTITYRKRAYEKLQISSQNELFRIVFDFLRPSQSTSRSLVHIG